MGSMQSDMMVGALSSCQLVEPDGEPTHRSTVAVSCGKMEVSLDILLREQNFVLMDWLACYFV